MNSLNTTAAIATALWILAFCLDSSILGYAAIIPTARAIYLVTK